MFLPALVAEGLFFSTLLFAVLVVFCLRVLNKLPQDCALVANTIRGRNPREVPATLAVVLLYWSAIALLVWYIAVPWLQCLILGYKSVLGPVFLNLPSLG